MSLGQFLVLEQLAQSSLFAAISSERSKCWKKAVEHYGKLLRILNKQNFSAHAEMEPHHKQLLYETYYHLGIAFQNVNQHGKAVVQYTKALQTSSIQKKSCVAGCTVGSCLHTPVLTRRAFAFVKCGETKKALIDADAAVVLDSLNPDVYCIRALVWCTMQEEEEAIKDLNYGLRINPSHACSLILRGNIKKHIRLENNSSLPLNDDQEQALQINYSSIRFLGIKDFNSPEISEFYYIFLWSLNVPHTVICVHLPSACDSLQGPKVHSQRASSAPGNSRPPVVNFIQFSEKAAIIQRQGEITASLSKGLAKRCHGTSANSHRASLQKTGVQQKTFESTGFSVFKIGRPGSLARMYNKPWNGDKLPVNEEAQRQKKFISFKTQFAWK